MNKNASKRNRNSSNWDAPTHFDRQMLLIYLGIFTWIQFKVGFTLPVLHSDTSSEDYELWQFLENRTDTFKSHFTHDTSLCPLPAQPRDVNNCNYPSCTSDANCTDTKQICCFNGCVHTCQNHLPPPAALDWVQDISNISSRNNASEDKDDFFTCSTTIRSLPARIRGCPDGFKCQVYEIGDPVTGSPNKGMCISEQATDVREDSGSIRSASTREMMYLPGGCFLKANEYEDLEKFLKHGHYVSCKCEDGSVLCKVGYNSTLLSS